MPFLTYGILIHFQNNLLKKKIGVNTSFGVKILLHEAKSNIYADKFSRQIEKPSGSLQLNVPSTTRNSSCAKASHSNPAVSMYPHASFYLVLYTA